METRTIQDIKMFLLLFKLSKMINYITSFISLKLK